MLSRRLLTISVVVTLGSGYLYLFEHKSAFVWPMGIGLACVMLVYIFQHQINWWWFRRFPPKLDASARAMYARAQPYYTTLSEGARQEFDTRARLFVEDKEFIAQGPKDVAEDIKYMVAFYAVMLTLHRDTFLFKPYDRVVLYLHPFISPNYPDAVHSYELEHDDGTIIFALEQLNAGFFSPQKFYQTGLHAFAELYQRQYLADVKIEDQERVWSALEPAGGWSRKEIEDFTGLPLTSPIPVMIHHWHARHSALHDADPEIAEAIRTWMNSPVARAGD